MIHRSSSLDTSVVLRLLVGEPVDQAKQAAAFLAQQLAAKALVHVCDLVLAEAYYALQHYYGMPKAEALAALALFAEHSGVTISNAASTVLGLENIASAKPGFVDRLIHGGSQSQGQTLITFEKAAKKLSDTHLI